MEALFIPQDPLAVFDSYLLPALGKLSSGAFVRVQGLTKAGLNDLSPGTIYLILRSWRDFRAISVIQHSLGLVLTSKEDVTHASFALLLNYF
jgi:hypothetical protein